MKNSRPKPIQSPSGNAAIPTRKRSVKRTATGCSACAKRRAALKAKQRAQAQQNQNGANDS